MRDVLKLTKLAGPLTIGQLPSCMGVHHARSIESDFLKAFFQFANGAFFKSDFGERINERADSAIFSGYFVWPVDSGLPPAL